MSLNLSPVCVVWLLWVSVMLCSVCTPVWSAPVCSNAPAGCHTLSLDNLLDRVLQHSARMHRVSNDLHSEWELSLVPSKNPIGRLSRTCHTSNILTPNGKENAQRMAVSDLSNSFLCSYVSFLGASACREQLTDIILQLLTAWTEPLRHFQQNNVHQTSSAHSLQGSDVSVLVSELRAGVQRVADKMQTVGLPRHSRSSELSPQAPRMSHANRWRLMNDLDILHCFRRDSNKVQNYLRILKCRIIPEHGC